MQVDDGAHAVRVDGGDGGEVGDGGGQAEAPPSQARQVGQDGAMVAPPRQYLRGSNLLAMVRVLIKFIKIG